jgi:2-C-methyl-D-erythritol 4-phosphate cytidylyltransferase/2-C-methyl-D-erythritol 2,4-cyclodiphosphate synthase
LSSHGEPRADAIVVAAGRSTRMAGADKLLARIAGRPLIAWTLDAVAAAPEVDRIVLVAGAGVRAAVAGADWLPPRLTAIVEGGERRQDSLLAGVRALDRAGPAADDRVILVHDGARPAVSPALVSAVVRATAEHGAAIPVLPLSDTIKRVVDGAIVETLDRSVLAAAQTPQGVRRGLLERAFAEFPPSGTRTFTDEGSLLEACRIPVHAIPGEPGNLKVTLPDDLSRVTASLRGVPVAAARRVGWGTDSHPFGPARGLVLGGVEIPEAPRLAGHSDGDVALHAIADALLGAAGLGDLGRLFPADERTPRGIASRELLAAVVRRLGDVGLRPAYVDVTIVAARPRLGGRLDEMRAAIAAILGLPAAAVSVKASTGNLDGMEGAGRGVSAHATASVDPVS